MLELLDVAWSRITPITFGADLDKTMDPGKFFSLFYIFAKVFFNI